MPPFEAVLFDFDGTLAANLDLKGMRQDLIAFTLQETAVPKEEIKPLYMLELIDYTATWLESEYLASEAYYSGAHKLIKDFEINAARSTQVFPETPIILSNLREAGTKVGVVTLNCDDAVRTVLPDIDKRVDAFLSRDHAEFLKPDPRHLQQCLHMMSRKADESVMVGDSKMDIKAGKALGMLSVGVLTGSSGQEELKQAGADVVLESISELLAFLEVD